MVIGIVNCKQKSGHTNYINHAGGIQEINIEMHQTAHAQSIPCADKATIFTKLQSSAVGTFDFVSVCLGGFTERSCTHTNWYSEVRRGSESPTDPTLARMIDAADLFTAVYLGKR